MGDAVVCVRHRVSGCAIDRVWPAAGDPIFVTINVTLTAVLAANSVADARNVFLRGYNIKRLCYYINKNALRERAIKSSVR